MRTKFPVLPVENPPAPLPAITPAALAALGPLLCLHGENEPSPLGGWQRATALVASIRLDSDGPNEALRFFDADGDCCWQLQLLPDSDFHAWERLLAGVPVEADRPGVSRAAWAWRRRDARRWRASALRLHALSDGRLQQLAVAGARLSPLGRACANRIARQAGAGTLAGDLPD